MDNLDENNYFQIYMKKKKSQVEMQNKHNITNYNNYYFNNNKNNNSNVKDKSLNKITYENSNNNGNEKFSKRFYLF